MLTRLKERVQAMLATEAKAAHRMGLTPNAISAIGTILALLSGVVYAEWRGQSYYLLLGAVFLLLSGFCDALDGVVARLYGQTSVFGGFFDSLLDRYADAAVYVGIILGGLCDTLWGLAALTGSLLVSYSRARAEAAGIKMETIGLAERAERMVIIATTSVVGAFWNPTTVMNVGVIALTVLANLTVVQRGVYVYQKLKKRGTS